MNSDKPLRVKILGVYVVAFRDTDGRAHVLSDTCIHRGGSLGGGSVINGRIACPYHGWEYSGDGQCNHIPSFEAGKKIPARAKVDSYPVIEKYGIVFAFLGDQPENERIPLYDIPEWDSQGWRASGLTSFSLSAYYERSMENGLDPVHNEFVHNLQGNIRFRPDRMSVSGDQWGTEVYIRMDPPKPGTTQLEHLRNDDDPENFGATSYHYGPNTLVTQINLSKHNRFVQYFFEQPIDTNHTCIFFINLRNCMLEPEQDEKLQSINLSIAEEDVNIVQELYPVRTPEVSTKEILVTGDECISAYRKHLRNWENLGWRIDTRAVQKQANDIAFAIPSPDRHNSGNWVLDTVPLLPATRQPS